MRERVPTDCPGAAGEGRQGMGAQQREEGRGGGERLGNPPRAEMGRGGRGAAREGTGWGAREGVDHRGGGEAGGRVEGRRGAGGPRAGPRLAGVRRGGRRAGPCGGRLGGRTRRGRALGRKGRGSAPEKCRGCSGGGGSSGSGDGHGGSAPTRSLAPGCAVEPGTEPPPAARAGRTTAATGARRRLRTHPGAAQAP